MSDEDFERGLRADRRVEGVTREGPLSAGEVMASAHARPLEDSDLPEFKVAKWIAENLESMGFEITQLVRAAGEPADAGVVFANADGRRYVISVMKDVT